MSICVTAYGLGWLLSKNSGILASGLGSLVLFLSLQLVHIDITISHNLFACISEYFCCSRMSILFLPQCSGMWDENLLVNISVSGNDL